MSEIIIVLAAVIARIIPHPANFAPIGALALYSGAKMSGRKAMVLPIAAMVISDLIIGFDSWAMRTAVYGSFGLICLIGKIAGRKNSPGRIVMGAIMASILFYLVTNGAVWLTGNWYPKTAAGLVQALVMGLPFLRNTLLGDLTYTGLFFGGYELARRWGKESVRAIISEE